MRFERLVMEAGEHSIALDLHSRLTIIAGVSQPERDALTSEIIGALGSGRDGLHLELQSDSSDRFAVFRPRGARHRVVNIGDASDVTSEFLGEDGNVDLLAKAGLSVEQARAAMSFSSEHLTSADESDLNIRRLAQLDQNELWAAAESINSARKRLEHETAEASGSSEDHSLIEEIETQHAKVETNVARNHQLRKYTMWSGATALGCVAPAVFLVGPLAALPLFLLTAVLAVATTMTSKFAAKARDREDAALESSGAQSYLGFHLQRVNGLLSSDQARKRMVTASEENKQALRRWTVIAGSIDVKWVIQNRERIATAVKLRNEVMGSHPQPHSDDEEASVRSDFAHALVTRLAQLRGLGVGQENFPALLNDPFAHLDDVTLATLLELLVRSAGHQQIILMTSDERVAQWARLESMTGDLAVIEPSNPTSVPSAAIPAIELRT